MSEIARLKAVMEGDERPLILALQRALSEIQNFKSRSDRTFAPGIIEIGIPKLKRDLAEADALIARAQARWAAKRPPVAPPPPPDQLLMGLAGATGRFDALPDADAIARIRGQGNGIVTDMFGISAQVSSKTGEQMAKELVQGLRRGYKATMADAREELFRGLINRDEFEQRGRQAAAVLNRGILSGIERIGDTGKLTPQLHAKLVSELQEAGLQAGAAMERALVARGQVAAQTLATNMRRAMGVAAPGGGGFLSGIGRGNAIFTAAISAGFGLESIARAEGKVEKAAAGIRTALQTTATFAASALGPKGLLIGALAMGTAAIVDHFSSAKKQMRELRKAFEDEITRMVRSADVIGIQEKIRDLEFGTPDKGVGMGGAFRGSIRDLEARIAVEQAAYDKADKEWNFQALATARRNLESLRAQLTPLTDERRQLLEAHALVGAMPTRGTGMLPAVVTSADSPFREGPTLLEQMADRVQRLTQSWELLNRPGERTNGILREIFDAARDVTAQLATMKNPFSEQAVSLNQMRRDLEKITSDLLPALSVQQTPTWDPFKGPRPLSNLANRIPLPTPSTPGLNADTPSRGSIFAMQAMDMMRGVGTVIKDVVLASFGPMAVLMKVLEPAITALEPLFTAFLTPLASVVRIMATGLEPVLRLLFPVIKGVAWVFALMYEVTATVTAGLARALGNLIIGIGKAIDSLPFVSAKGIIKAGENMLKFSDGVNDSVEEMRKQRKELEKMGWNDVKSAAEDTAAALRNVPQVWMGVLNAMRVQATGAPIGVASTGGSVPTGSGWSGGGGPGTRGLGGATVNVHAGAIVVQGGGGSAEEIADAVVTHLERLALQQYGDSSRWSEVTI